LFRYQTGGGDERFRVNSERKHQVPAVRQRSRGNDFSINCDSMVTDLWPYLAVRCIENNLIRLLEGHVAIYTVMKDLSPQDRILPAAFHPVAGQTAVGIQGRVPLGFVDIVTGRARHAAGPETPAAPQLLHLVSMHVVWSIRGVFRKGQKLPEDISRGKRKGGGFRGSRSSMTQCT
jgi:hypothetical protein